VTASSALVIHSMGFALRLLLAACAQEASSAQPDVPPPTASPVAGPAPGPAAGSASSAPDACGAPVVCATSDSTTLLRITKPGVYDGRGHRVPGIMINASGVTVRNFVVSGGTQAGVRSQGANNTIDDNDISDIGYGHDDIDAIGWFGDGTKILRNRIHDLVRGALRDAPPTALRPTPISYRAARTW
jgi:hypothetical protein